uniref:Uncharacterized protein n=1 Tax=Sphaerodactylus townsendi TaxID=933632 RepID=A0ACB8F363_9SAUR
MIYNKKFSVILAAWNLENLALLSRTSAPPPGCHPRVYRESAHPSPPTAYPGPQDCSCAHLAWLPTISHAYFIAPDVTGLPTVPESRNLTEYFVAVDVNNMLQLYASMLHERRIIITSSKLSTTFLWGVI